MVLHLPSDLQVRLTRLARQGGYRNGAEALREALRLLEEQNRRSAGESCRKQVEHRARELSDEEELLLDDADNPALAA